jgi:hypothetical protein
VDGNDQLVERLLAGLDLKTKISLLSGRDYWSLPPVAAVGLDALVMSDGPVGVRGTGWAPSWGSAFRTPLHHAGRARIGRHRSTPQNLDIIEHRSHSWVWRGL